MIRPSPFLGGAAVVSVLLGVGASFADFSTDAPLTIVEKPYGRAAAADSRGELPKVRSYPAHEGKLASPFLPEHPTRDQSKRMAAPPKPQKLPAPPARGIPEMPRQKKQPRTVRLVGVVSSEAGRCAILSVGGRHVLLSEGETKDGITLLALTEREAAISSENGELTLQVGR